jgi:hypothetical protein
MQREQHHQGDIGDLQQGLGEVSSCGLCRAKGDPSAFVPTFCLRQYFVDTNNSVDANILSATMFCWRQCFVGANILSPPIFLIVFRLRLII